MSESQLPEPQEPKPRFRLNVQVFQIFGLVIIALALPFTILILGLLDIRKNTKPSATTKSVNATQRSTEVPGLRSTLDSIAASHLPRPTLDDGIRRYGFVLPKPNSTPSETALRSALDSVGAICLSSSNETAEKFIASVSVDVALQFEEALLSLNPITKPLEPIDSRAASSWSYEITIQQE